MELIYKEQAFAIIGACFEVYNELGCGFLEPVYQECLDIELGMRGIPAIRQRIVELFPPAHCRASYVPDTPKPR
jgi:GxxExxY protein